MKDGSSKAEASKLQTAGHLWPLGVPSLAHGPVGWLLLLAPQCCQDIEKLKSRCTGSEVVESAT